MADLEMNNAALSIQSIRRGRDARAAVGAKKASAQEQAKQQEAAQHERASAVLGAGVKGYSQRRAKKLEQQEMGQKATCIQAKFRGRKERADPAAEANIRRERSKNDPKTQAATYMKFHNVMELFEMLGQMVISEKPDDPRSFLVEQLERMSAVKDRTSPMNFFSEEDIDTLYSMYDVGKRGITPMQCREALDGIGLHAVAVPEVSVISAELFKSLVPAAL